MNKDTLRSSHPSLFSLRMLLFTAELETPAQPPRLPRDPDELLAMRLIEQIKHPAKPELFMGAWIESPQPFRHEAVSVELASVHA